MRASELKLVTAYITPAQAKALRDLRHRGVKLQPLLREAIDAVIRKHKGSAS